MGAFYGNVLVARTCAEVAPLLAGATSEDGGALRGYAIPAGPGHTVLLFPDPDTEVIEPAGPLSRLLGTARPARTAIRWAVAGTGGMSSRRASTTT